MDEHSQMNGLLGGDIHFDNILQFLSEIFKHARRVINFSALVTAMLASSGDEAFIMIAMMPSKALLLFLILFCISIAAGLILNLIPLGKSMMFLPVNHLILHEQDPECTCFEPSLILPQLKKISFERAVLLSGGIIFTIFILSGDLGSEE